MNSESMEDKNEVVEEAIEAFLLAYPDQSVVDDLLWKMFYHATLFDISKNGAPAFLEEYGDLITQLKHLIGSIRASQAE